MNNTDNSLVKNRSSELQKQLHDALRQMSLEELQILADFANYLTNNNSKSVIPATSIKGIKAYLANVESETATQELLAIPGLLERVKQNQTTPKTDYVNWRDIRSDV